MEYSLIRDEEGMLTAKESWNAICDRMPGATPFQTWEWNYIWWKNREPEDSLYVIKAYEGKTVYGYAPLVVKNDTAEFIGGRDMDYGRFVVCDKMMEVIKGFTAHLLGEKYDIHLQEMAARDTQLHMVQKIFEANRNHIVHKTTRTVYVDLQKYNGFNSYFLLLSQSMRNKTIKAGLKRGLVIGKETVTEELLAEIQEIYIDRQRARTGDSTIAWAVPIIREMSLLGLISIYVAREQNKAIGFLACMQYNNAQYIWLVAFRMEYRELYPGQLLFYQALKDGFESGNRMVDFMRGDYNFKMRWECALDTNYTVEVIHSLPTRMKKKTIYYLRPRAKKIKGFIYAHPKLLKLYEKYV